MPLLLTSPPAALGPSLVVHRPLRIPSQLASSRSSTGCRRGARPAHVAGAGASVGPGPSSSSAAAAGPGEPATIDYSLEPFKAVLKSQDRTFKCTMCGKCCTGEGEIWVNEQEAQAIAKQINLSVTRFYQQYTKQYSRYKGWRMLKTKEGSSMCAFLGEDNKCSIHTVRPSQCSTYPWWPELMHPKEWDWEKENICEGFDHPEALPLDLDEAARQLREANKMTAMRMASSTQRTSTEEASWAEQVILPDQPNGVTNTTLNGKPWP